MSNVVALQTERIEANAMDNLTLAMEYTLCALRAVAAGEPVESKEVQDPLEWAQGKIKELILTVR